MENEYTQPPQSLLPYLVMKMIGAKVVNNGILK
jgi:hypothetical protein